jgi:hypothetical protein
VLGVAPDVDEAGLRRAYRRLVLAHHPDRTTEAGRAAAAARTAEITTAYRVLADPEARGRYDTELGLAPRHRGRVGVRTAARPSGGDPRHHPRPSHDPVLRRVHRGGRAVGPPRPEATPLQAVLPRLVAAALVGVTGLAVLVLGTVAGSGWAQTLGLTLLGGGMVAGVLVELGRKDGI